MLEAFAKLYFQSKKFRYIMYQFNYLLIPNDFEHISEHHYFLKFANNNDFEAACVFMCAGLYSYDCFFCANENFGYAIGYYYNKDCEFGEKSFASAVNIDLMREILSFLGTKVI